MTTAHEAEKGSARQEASGGYGHGLHGSALRDGQGTGLRGAEHTLGGRFPRKHRHSVENLLVKRLTHATQCNPGSGLLAAYGQAMSGALHAHPDRASR